MKNKIWISNAAIICLIFLSFLVSCSGNEQSQSNSEEKTETTEETKQLKHVVMFKFKDDADPAAIAKAHEGFLALPSKIPEIRGFEWGLNNSPEGLNKGMTHCYTLTFNSEADREVYLPHPDHKAFGALLGGILDDLVVVDYWAE